MIQIMLPLLGVALALAGWQYQRAENYREQVIELKISVQAQENTIEYQQLRAEQDAATIQEWGNRNADIQAKTVAMAAHINELRGLEQSRSLAAPFESGGDADGRRRNILLRFADQGDPDGPEQADSGDTPGAPGA